MASAEHPLSVLIVAPKTSTADALLQTLYAARLPVRGMYTRHLDRLPQLLATQPCDLLIIRLGEAIDATASATAYRNLPTAPPLLVVYPPDCAAAELVGLIQAGAAELVGQDDDQAFGLAAKRLTAVEILRDRSARLREEVGRLQGVIDALLEVLATPIAAVCDARITSVNPAFERLFAPSGDAAGLRGTAVTDLVAPAFRDGIENLLGAGLLVEVIDPLPAAVTFIDARGQPRDYSVALTEGSEEDPNCRLLLLQPVAAAQPPAPATAPMTERTPSTPAVLDSTSASAAPAVIAGDSRALDDDEEHADITITPDGLPDAWEAEHPDATEADDATATAAWAAAYAEPDSEPNSEPISVARELPSAERAADPSAPRSAPLSTPAPASVSASASAPAATASARASDRSDRADLRDLLVESADGEDGSDPDRHLAPLSGPASGSTSAPVATAWSSSSNARAAPPPGREVLDRAAMMRQLDELLGDPSPFDQDCALAFVLLDDYPSLRRRHGLQGAAALVKQTLDVVARNLPEPAWLACPADDAIVALLMDLAPAPAAALWQRLAAALDASSGLPGCHLSVVPVEAGEDSPERLLDRAFAAATATGQAAAEHPPPEAAARAKDAVAPQSELPSETRSEARSEARSEPRSEPVSGPASGPVSGSVTDLRGVMESRRFSRPVVPPTSRPAAPVPLRSGRVRAPLQPPRGAGERPADDGPQSGSEPLDSLESQIQRALRANSFKIMFQPIISLMGESDENFSVLLRLEDINKLLLTATELLGPAARTGHLPEIDRWVMTNALSELSKRRKLGERIGFFLSLSAETLLDSDLLLWICDALREFEVRGNWLTFQLQERDARMHSEAWGQLVEGLHSIKCRVAVNQFGHGEKPEALLAQVPVDYVKFAPELAMHIHDDGDKQRRLGQLVSVARQHGAKTIVTGVEDANALTVLWHLNIDYVQGNFLQPPTDSLELPAN